MMPRPKLLLLILSLVVCVVSQCPMGNHQFTNGEYWVQNRHFNVTCRRGVISVVNCITDAGTFIPVSQEPFIEDGIKYTCLPTPDESSIEAAGRVIDYYDLDTYLGTETEVIGDCDHKTEYTYAGFAVSCESNKILGCVNVRGEVVINEFFVTQKRALKFCKVYGKSKRVRIENKGCFNGSLADNANDLSMHVAKYSVWTDDRGKQLRCGDDGVQIYKCPLLDGGMIHSGTAWIDEEGTLNVCQ